jgi:hypothetical protein
MLTAVVDFDLEQKCAWQYYPQALFERELIDAQHQFD